MSGLPVERVQQLESRAALQRWLVEGLWAAGAVGIVGGEPKCCKSFLALDLAVAVASGTACLRRYAVALPGRVLLYAAEDPLPLVRCRLEGICRAAGADFSTLDVHVITCPRLRLDLANDQQRLATTVARLRPRLLVLDPFVRLHAIDENAAGEVASVLGVLRDLQRRFDMAVLLVHHARKGASALRAGQALRGSSELHAWGDSNLYLARHGDHLRLAIEHRAAASTDGVLLKLDGTPDAVALQVASDRDDPHDAGDDSIAHRVEQALAAADGPMHFRQLRSACGMRASRLSAALAQLVERGRVSRSELGCQLITSQTPAFPTPIHTTRETLSGNAPSTRLPGETDSGPAEAQPEKG